MLLRWILKLLGLGFLLGVGMHCDVNREEAKEKAKAYRSRAARRLHRLADRIAAEGEESGQEPGA
jgi:hypothetical protein